jgi:hypothetical protein
MSPDWLERNEATAPGVAPQAQGKGRDDPDVMPVELNKAPMPLDNDSGVLNIQWDEAEILDLEEPTPQITSPQALTSVNRNSASPPPLKIGDDPLSLEARIGGNRAGSNVSRCRRLCCQSGDSTIR